MTDQQFHTPPRGIPGKWFALPFGMVLLFAVWLVVSMAFRFQAIMKQLEATREVWPKAAIAMHSHFNAVSSELQAATESSRSLSKDLEERLSRFSQSSIFDEQSITAKEMLDLVSTSSSDKSFIEKLSTDETVKLVVKSERMRSQLQSGIVGWCTVEGLRLKLPPLFVME